MNRTFHLTAVFTAIAASQHVAGSSPFEDFGTRKKPRNPLKTRIAPSFEFSFIFSQLLLPHWLSMNLHGVPALAG